MNIEVRKEKVGDTEMWVCVCEEINLAAQGRTKYLAKISFLNTLRNQAVLDLSPWTDEGPDV